MLECEDFTVRILWPENNSLFYVRDRIWFRGFACGGIGRYEFNWSFGDGWYGKGKEVYHSYNTPGVYRVRLEVRDEGGNYGSDSVWVRIAHIPPRAFYCFIAENGCPIGECILALSSLNNGHAEDCEQGNYRYKVCCINVSEVNVSNSCSFGFTGLIALSSLTNAHAEEYGFGNYPWKVCIKGKKKITCWYDTLTNCTHIPKAIVVFSLSSDTNAHIGNATAFPNLVLCCKESS
ncbi:hypothetical protein DRJ19_05660 [Candidatus Woesearchaeota archaeon]|mgnify:CR=1 FL=1|nr:MAG: hypothetical protein DRJ19_05660 [Candidatus Woesearchaeota archaeon]